MRVLSISSPGGDRGPAVGYRNHFAALSRKEFQIVEINQHLWDRPDLMKSFDVAWAYVRFNPLISQRCFEIGLPVIGGPNVALERADIGVTDEWENWYLNRSNVTVNLNVADYYSDRVKLFVSSKMQCKTLEYCYESHEILDSKRFREQVDVLIYEKDRVNDGEISRRASALREILDSRKISHKTITYGKHTRNEYIEACLQSKVCAWLSIEDYCSLAQIEAHLSGCCVVGTPYNLTIPAFEEALCHNSQKMREWIRWEDDERVALDYSTAIEKVLAKRNLDDSVREISSQRHSYEKYRLEVRKLLET